VDIGFTLSHHQDIFNSFAKWIDSILEINGGEVFLP